MRYHSRQWFCLLSVLLCTLSEMTLSTRVRAGVIETPYDSLLWQSSDWGPERSGFRLRVSMPSEVEYNEPILAEIDLALRLPSEKAWSLLGRRLLISNPILSIQGPGGCNSEQYVGVIDSGSNQYLIGGIVDYQTTFVVRFEITRVMAILLTSITKQSIGSPRSEPYLVQEARPTYTTLGAGPHEGKVSIVVEFLGDSTEPVRVAAACLPFEVLPRVWVTYPIKIICPARFLPIGDSVFVPDMQNVDTVVVRMTGGTYLGLRTIGAGGYKLNGLSVPPRDGFIVLPSDRFYLPSEPREIAPWEDRYGYTVFETACTPGHMWDPGVGPGYRELLRRNPLDWRSSKKK